MSRYSAIGVVTAFLVIPAGLGARAHADETPTDVVVVIDTSDTTEVPSGLDLDGDGVVGGEPGDGFLSRLFGLTRTDTGDSILAAEVAGVRHLLKQLDPRTTRVGIVVFSGDDDAHTPDAYTEVPLTSDYAEVEDGLEVILWRGPYGLTNMVAAVNLATIELVGSQSARSTNRESARRRIIFLSDGLPTLPLQNSPLHNADLAIEQAERAAKFDVRIDTFAIGEDALSGSLAMVEMARVSGGVFTPVRDPGSLAASLTAVRVTSPPVSAPNEPLPAAP